ncbi:MAG: glutamate-5-semialdehyde dehydrogenase [Opitutaceae bacterium]|nr:glutamate-5-semialdehyde dehydrogenase [Opitutaceae bacterium]
MLRPIFASARFTLLTALAIMVGGLAIEWLASSLLSLGHALLLQAGMMSVDPEEFIAATALQGIVAKLVAAAAIVALALYRLRERPRDLGRLGFGSWVLPLALPPIIAGTIIALSEVDNMMRALLSEDTLTWLNFSPSLDQVVEASWQGPLLAIVIAPVTEEIVFRGLILRGLLARWRPWPAIVLSSVLFGVMHLNPAQLPVALLIGGLLGWIYVRTRSLGLCIAGHALNNASSYLPGEAFAFQVRGFNFVPDEAATGAIFHPWWFDGLGLALVGLGCWVIHRFAPIDGPWRVPPVVEPPPLPTKTFCEPPVLADAGTSMASELTALVTALAQRARAASLVLATAPRAKKDIALTALADLIDASHAVLMDANAQDLASPEAAALTAAARDRLTLDEKRLRHLAASVREVVALPDPVGTLLEEITRPNGLRIRKVRVPIGVIGIVYESRPNVTVDCAILCLKSGNASILRGGKECFHTNTALAALIRRALEAAGLPADAVQLVPTTDRAALTALLKLDALIHCIIPRGGESLIRHVAENSTIPVIKHFKGVCFIYADQAADLAMAEAITLNAKVQRPSACNAAEQLLVHRAVAEKFLPSVARALVAKNVQLRCDAASAAILARAGVATTPAAPADFTAEFLDYVIAVRVVDSLDAAIATINRDSSNHSDAIVTADAAAARRFLAEVDSATVYWNASTRFTDGYEFGYGAEIGISTDRLHARGPMGLPELCSYKFLIEGTGQVRG